MEKSPDKVRVGVVGLNVGRAHLDRYRKCPRAELVAVCDLDTALLERTAREFEVGAFDDVKRLFKSDLIDAVSIVTPNQTHAPLTIAALRAGLHVLCEKPMAMNAAQARRMVAAADEAKRKLAIHFNHRMAPNVQAMRRYVEAGEVGQIYFARTVWHRRRGFPDKPSFLQNASAGGGAMIDLGVHILDIALYLMDYPQPVAVSAQAVNRFGELDAPGMKMDVDDFASAYIRFDNGAALALEVSWACHHEHPEQMMTAVYGDKAGLSRCVEHYTNPVIRLHKREHGMLVTTGIDEFPSDCPSVHDDFVAAILADRQPLCSARHGLITMQIIDAVYKSAATGRDVRIK